MTDILAALRELHIRARHSLSLAFRIDPPSLLIPPIDAGLLIADKRLTRTLGHGSPLDWEFDSPTVRDVAREYPDLVRLYQWSVVAEREEWSEALSILRQLASGTEPGPLHGSALRLFIEYLFYAARDRDFEPDDRDCADLSRECRESCDTAFAAYRGSAWEPIVLFYAEAALGILDYHAGEFLTSKIHLQRALEHHAALFRIGRFGADHLRGSVHFTLARLSLHRGDLQGSVKELRIAARHLEGYWKAEALNALSREELEADRPEKAYAAALEGLQCKPPEYSRDWLDDDLRGNLAHALFLLRRYEEAKWELRDVIERGVYLSRKEWAARFLEMLEREFPGRR